jgi:hypothetical protein
MQIKRIKFRDRLQRIRRFDTRLAKVLVRRPDLTYVQIETEFGISEKASKRHRRDRNLDAQTRVCQTP